MKKLIDIRTASELSQADDRRSPLTDRVFSLAEAKPKGDRRNGQDKGMRRLPFLQPHSFALLGRVAPIGRRYETVAL
jgi:hypothetical protein